MNKGNYVNVDLSPEEFNKISVIGNTSFIPQDRMKYIADVKTRVASTEGFYFPVPTHGDVPLNKYLFNIKLISESFLDSYMRIANEKEVPDSFFKSINSPDQSALDIAENKIKRCIRFISRSEDWLGGSVWSRIYDGSNSAIMICDKPSRKNTILLTITIHRDGVSAIYFVELKIEGDRVIFNNLMHTIFFTSKVPKKARMAADRPGIGKDILSGKSNELVLCLEKLLELCVTELTDRAEKKFNKFKQPEYNETEMYFFKAVMRLFDEKSRKITHCIGAGVSSIKDIDEDEYKKFDEIKPISFQDDFDRNEYPKVDLKDKEWTFIYKFCTKRFPEGLNLIPYLESPRYGKVLKIDVTLVDENGCETECETVVSYILHSKENKARFYITDSHKSVDAVVAIDVDDLSHFTGAKNMVQIRQDVIIKDEGAIVPTIEQLRKMSPILHDDLTMYMKMVDDIIRLYITIVERPERHRMVKCSELRPSAKQRKKNVQPTEKDYVISRILKTKQDAKDFVDEMTKQVREGRRDAEYTVESWDRVGHWRTYKSGKKVWIEETSCRRHLPLTDKEIHIKL